MISHAQNDFNFYQSPDENGIGEPYVLVRPNEVTYITNRFHVWSRMMATHPRLAAMCEESKSAHLDIVANWHTAVGKAMQDSIVPFVGLPEKLFKAVMWGWTMMLFLLEQAGQSL